MKKVTKSPALRERDANLGLFTEFRDQLNPEILRVGLQNFHHALLQDRWSARLAVGDREQVDAVVRLDDLAQPADL